MDRLRIAQVSPLWTSVPPAGYGGAELVVHWLTEELVRRGHDVTLFASGDSRTTARLVPISERNLIDTMASQEAYFYEPYVVAAATEALRRACDFDLIHCHLGAAMIPLSVLTDTPVLHTVHAGLDAVDELWVLERYEEAAIAAISRSQVAALPHLRRERIPVIHHGCDFASYEASFHAGEYLAFVGRMGPHKNPAGAIAVAKACGIPIRLAGAPQNEYERSYFEQQVRPLIDGRQVVYLGAVSQAEKIDLLKGASALLFPIQWEEHFGLVMIEAMASATPVLAIRRGSVAEVIDPGVTGFYADSVADLEALVPAIRALDRRKVWERARSRFTHLRMVDEYVELYDSMVRQSR